MRARQLVVMALTVMICVCAYGQPGGGGSLPCEPGPPQGCVELFFNGKDYDVIIDEYVSEVQISEHFGPWVWEDACNCALLPCDQRVDCEPSTYSHTRQTETCWEVTGGVEVSGKTGLLAKLFGELEVTVNIGGSDSSCTTVSETITFKPSVSDCWRHAARDGRAEHRVTGWLDMAETVKYWACTLSNGMILPVMTTCGVERYEGWADNVASRQVQRSQWPECMGGPSDEDLDGRVRTEQCCEPIEPCRQGGPCCGCYS
jgi:hypothetical protein